MPVHLLEMLQVRVVLKPTDIFGLLSDPLEVGSLEQEHGLTFVLGLGSGSGRGLARIQLRKDAIALVAEAFEEMFVVDVLLII